MILGFGAAGILLVLLWYLGNTMDGPMLVVPLFRRFSLISKRLITEGSEFPVFVFTFAYPGNLGLNLGVGDHLKLWVPYFNKPRSYSPTAQRPGSFDLAVKLLDGGVASEYLMTLEVADSAFFARILLSLERRGSSHIGIIALGVGITEAIEVARAELQKQYILPCGLVPDRSKRMRRVVTFFPLSPTKEFFPIDLCRPESINVAEMFFARFPNS